MPATTEELVKRVQDSKSNEQRQVEALEAIADALREIQNELVSIRMSIPKAGSLAAGSFGR